MEQNTDKEKSAKKKARMMFWLKKFGLAGFLFFFIKGLIWLAVIFGLAKYFTGN